MPGMQKVRPRPLANNRGTAVKKKPDGIPMTSRGGRREGGAKEGVRTTPYFEADIRAIRDALDHPAYEAQRELLAANLSVGMTVLPALQAAGFPVGKRAEAIELHIRNLVLTHAGISKRVLDLAFQRSAVIHRENARQMVETGLTPEMVIGGLMKLATVCMEPTTFHPSVARAAFKDLGEHLGLFKDQNATPPIDPKLYDLVMRLGAMPEHDLDKVILAISGVVNLKAIDITPTQMPKQPEQDAGDAGAVAPAAPKPTPLPTAGAYDHLTAHARPRSAGA